MAVAEIAGNSAALPLARSGQSKVLESWFWRAGSGELVLES